MAPLDRAVPFQNMNFLNLYVHTFALAFWEKGQNAAQSVA
jgi:hypothetical protein